MDASIPSFEPLLRFWIGEPGDDPLKNQALWFKRDPALDEELGRRFGELLERGGRGELEAWRETPRGLAAYVILLDQMPRNIHRGTPKAFAYDARALDAARDGLRRGIDRELGPAERWFLYMPLMHAEDLDAQDECVRRFEAFAAESTGALADALRGAADFGVRHRDIIARFGRFPHRNALLGRPSTDEETEFLKQPGSSF